MFKSGLAIAAAMLLSFAAADNRPLDGVADPDNAATTATIDDDTALTTSANMGDVTAADDTGNDTGGDGDTPRRPKTKVIVTTVAAEKNLVPEEKRAADNVEVMICGRERIGTGSRLSRRVCRTVQQLERESELRKAMVDRSSNRFQRRPAVVGGRTANPDRNR